MIDCKYFTKGREDEGKKYARSLQNITQPTTIILQRTMLFLILHFYII